MIDGVVNVRMSRVKAVFKRMRFSRKLVLIGGGILLLAGATGSAAVFIGSERLFGPSYASVNGLTCDVVQTVNIKKNGSLWIRKFVRTAGGDGTERVKTALRVAKAVYEKQKPDLVQVSVLDKDGPDLRSEMRGRAIAAQVVFIPDQSKLPEGTESQKYSAFYYDGPPNGSGQFYGLRIDLPLEDAETMAASLTDMADCNAPVEVQEAGGHGAKKSDGHGEKAGHGEAKESGGHGEAPTEAGHDEPEAEGHGATPSPQAHGETNGDELLTSTPEAESESMFSLAYIKSLIFGKGASTAQAAEEEPAAHDAPPADAPKEAGENLGH